MDENTAEQLAAIVGGEAWQSGGGIWVVSVHREDGSLVVLGGDAICEYENDEALDASQAKQTIILTIPTADELWVVVDGKGNVFFRNGDLKRGWLHEDDAKHEALGYQSRDGERYFVVQQSEANA